MIIQLVPYPASTGSDSTGSGPIPAFRASGTVSGVNSAGSFSVPGVPTGTTTNDILLLITETDPGDTVAAPAGYTEVTGSPWTTGIGTQLGLFWKRAGASESSPSVARPTGADHCISILLAFSGCVTTGSPIHAVSSGTSSGTSALSVPGLTTTINNCLIVDVVCAGDDTTASQFSAWTNASLGSPAMAEIMDAGATTGGGGRFGAGNGGKAAAGSVSATSVTKANTTDCVLTKIALLGP